MTDGGRDPGAAAVTGTPQQTLADAGEDEARSLGRSTWLAVGAMCMAVFAVANDFTAMSVVLPTIEGELDTTLSRVQWVVNGYALVFGILIVPGGRLADIFGRREVLFVGATIFAGFSLLGGLAPNIWLLIGARCLMGVGAAMIWPAVLGLMYAILPPSKAGLAGGLVIGVAGLGNAAGPVIAGALAEVSWRYIFYLNVPIAAAAILVTWRLVHVESPEEREAIDYLGTLLLAVSLGALLGALTVAPAQGWTSAAVVGGVAVFAVLMAGFVVHQRRSGENALVPPSVMGTAPFRWACLAVGAMSVIFFAAMLYLPQWFQKILDDGTLTAGITLLPFVGTFAVASFLETWLLGKIGMKAVVTAGATCLFLGPLLILVLIDDDSALASFLPGMVVLGAGVGLFYSSVTTAALTALDESRSALAGGLVYMFQLAGGAVGLGITTALFISTANAEIQSAATDIGVTLSSQEATDIQGVLAGTDTSQQVIAGHASQAAQLTQVVEDAFVTGMRWAFLFVVISAFVGLAITFLRVAGPPSRLGRDVGAGTGSGAA